jgi:hypothetical protein
MTVSQGVSVRQLILMVGRGKSSMLSSQGTLVSAFFGDGVSPPATAFAAMTASS